MPQPRWVWIVLVFVTLSAFLIRFWWLDRAPRGVLIDEAHYGYIAYSLANTGRDEHGVRNPLIFQGFGDQKLPIYGYLLIPFVKWWGLNVIAIRLPSVIVGTLLVPLIFIWLQELGMNRKFAVLGAILVAISPWTFMLSRFAFESNVALVLFVAGLIFLTKAFRHRPGLWLALTAAAWGFTWYTYVAYRPVVLVLSFLCIGLAVVKKRLSLRIAALFFLVMGLLIAPLFSVNLSGSGTARFQQVGIFFDQGIALEVDQQRTFCTSTLPKLICYALWNKGTVVSRELLYRYLEVFSPNYLITEGDSQLLYLSVAKTGQFFAVVYPLLLLGLVAITFQVEGLALSGVIRWLVLSGLLVSPIPAVLAGDPQKVRLSPLLPFLIVIAVLGAQLVWTFLPRRSWKLAAAALFMALLGVNTVSYLTNFWAVHTVKNDLVYQSYLPELFAQTETLKRSVAQGGTSARVYIKPFFSDPIMAYAYYAQVDPVHYQSSVVLGEREASGFQHAIQLDDYYVTGEPISYIGCQAKKTGYPALYVSNEEFYGEQFNDATFLAKINSVSGAVAYAFIYDAVTYVNEAQIACP